MALNVNSITVVGNLTRDPELRYTQGGKATVRVGVAVNRSYQVNGEWQEATTYLNLVAWDQLAENIAASLTKGARVLATGRLDVREYDDREGVKRTTVEIVVDDVAASLRRASVTIEKNPGRGEDAGAPRAARSSAPAADEPFYGDEEPF